MTNKQKLSRVFNEIFILEKPSLLQEDEALEKLKQIGFSDYTPSADILKIKMRYWVVSVKFMVIVGTSNPIYRLSDDSTAEVISIKEFYYRIRHILNSEKFGL